MAKKRVITKRDEKVFKLLIQLAKSLSDKTDFLENYGISISELSTASGKIEDCIFDYFEVPEDNTTEKIIDDDDGNTTILPGCFCRDGGGEILWDYTSGSSSIDLCFKKFKEYLDEVFAEYPSKEKV